MPQVENVNEIYALLCRNLLPIGMSGMLIAAMFSATMSMISSDYNATAAVLTNDVYRRFWAPGASHRALLIVARGCTFLVGLLSLAIAGYVMHHPGKDDLFQLMVRLFSLFLPPVAIPMLLGLITRRVSNLGGLAGLLAGIAVGLLVYFLDWFGTIMLQRKEEIITLCTVTATLLGVGVGTWLRPSLPEQQARIQRFFTRQDEPETPLTLSPSSPADDFSPMLIIGISIGSLGLLLIGVMLVPTIREGSAVSLAVGGIMVLIGALFWMGGFRRT